MRAPLAPKSVRRLLSADGYMDLNMPEQALVELQKMPEGGPLEGPRHLLSGIALKQLDRSQEAISHLEKAARLMPSPVRRFAWRELVDCYRAAGSEKLAEMADKLAGDVDLQLRITLPFAQTTIELSMAPKST